jgi:putative hydrolase of the HAD superfamily
LKIRDSIRYVLVDLDETMYPKDTGIMELIGERINEYMSGHLGIASEDIGSLRQSYYERYGTTGRGLYLHYDVDVHEYFEFVHDLPIEEMLQPEPQLDRMLGSLDVEKAIFTNATVEHARRVLRALGVERHFGSLIGIKELDFFPKPDVRAYEKALALVGAQAEECVLVDDRVRNLTPGRLLGMTTILVGSQIPEDGADYAIEEVVELGGAMETIRSRERGHR